MFRGLTSRLVCLAVAAVAVAGLVGCTDSAGTVSMPAVDLVGPRLLVIAPHPDDETVGAGGAIALARQRGWDVTVVFVTNGDGFWQAVRKPGGPMPSSAQMQAYGASRAAEARRATTALGVPQSNVIFLGFPDGSTHFLWGANWQTAVLGRNGARTVPYAFALKPKAPYTGSELESELEGIVKQVRPTTILIPDAADVHRDHWAVGAFSEMALVRTAFAGQTLTYIVHRAGFPRLRGDEIGQPLEAPSALLGNGTSWLSLPVNDAARQAQTAALAAYRTQLRADGPLVRSFVRPNEVLGVGPAAFIGTGTVTLREGTHDPAFRGGQPWTTIKSVELSRGDASATVGLVLGAPARPAALYALHVRALGPGGAMRFYDAQVSAGKLTAPRTAKESVAGKGSLLEFGPVVRVKLPADLLDGAQWLFVGADTYSGVLTADHAAWRMVRVLPH